MVVDNQVYLQLEALTFVYCSHSYPMIRLEKLAYQLKLSDILLPRIVPNYVSDFHYNLSKDVRA